jgi:hypothetical protein
MAGCAGELYPVDANWWQREASTNDATQQMLLWRQQEQKLRLDRMQDPEAVAQAITEHCAGCNVGHPGLVAHTDLVFLIQWKSYAGTDLVFLISWETQDGLLGWAAYNHHLSLLQQYHNETGLEMAAAAAAPIIEDAVYDASYESGEDVPRLSHAVVAIQAANTNLDDGPNSSDSSDDTSDNTDVEVQTDAEDEESDDTSTSGDDSDVSDDL